MSARDLRKSDQLTGLQRVIKTRLSRATHALQKELEGLRKIELEIETRKAQINTLQSDILVVQQFLSEDSVRAAEAGSIEAADYRLGLERRYWVDYDMQREQYYLDLTYDELKEKAEKVHEARRLFRSLKYKSDTLNGKLRENGIQKEASKTSRAEAEFQDNLLHGNGAAGTAS